MCSSTRSVFLHEETSELRVLDLAARGLTSESQRMCPSIRSVFLHEEVSELSVLDLAARELTLESQSMFFFSTFSLSTRGSLIAKRI